MTTHETFVVAGAGLASAKAVEALRTEGFNGRILVFGDESHRPYDRPPLSKGFLQGSSKREELFVHPSEWYREHDVELHVGTPITSIDRDASNVVTVNNERFSYDRLLLTTGSSPRHLNVPGADFDNVLYLRTLDDSEALREALAPSGRVAIIGGGWIGLETAAAARAVGCTVTVIEMAQLPLLNVLGREVAEHFAALHRSQGVTFELETGVAAIGGHDSQATEVRLTDGRTVSADVVVVGVGIVPNAELAVAAGLRVDNGIVVDEHLATSDSDIFAAGDVANVYYPFLDTHLRLEHWSAALNQGPVAAANMVGREVAYDKVPYFFSDQYDMGMEYNGFAAQGHYDHVIFRGDPATGQYIAFWMNDGRVAAGMNVNIWDVTDDIANLVRSRQKVDASRLSDASVPLGELVGDSSAGT